MSVSLTRKIWISLFSILAMLMSSFASSAPLMTFQMLSSSYVETEAATHCAMTSSPEMSHHQTNQTHSNQPAQPSCDSGSDKAHNCCGSVCVTVFALFSPQDQLTHLTSYLALIHPEAHGHAIYRQASLYRPPIA